MSAPKKGDSKPSARSAARPGGRPGAKPAGKPAAQTVVKAIATAPTPATAAERPEPLGTLVPAELTGERCDLVVRTLLGLSWKKAREAIASGKVFVDGKVSHEIERPIAGGQRVGLRMSAPRPATARRLAFEGNAIAHLDGAVVVVRKPPGISTVPYGDEDPEEARGTLDALVREVLAARDPSSSGRAALGVVHRLDKETSGLLVFTRTVEAKQFLADQFRKHTVHRRYYAIVHGRFVAPRSYRSYFVENRGDGLRGSGPHGRREGQLAVSHVEPLEALEGATLIACSLETGRTHQIRIHLSEGGFPLVGDRVYTRHFRGPIIEAPRLMLHAAELGFVHPVTKREMRFSEPLPEDFEAVLARLRTPGMTVAKRAPFQRRPGAGDA